MSHMAQDTELAGHVLGGKYRLIRPVSDGPRPVYEARHTHLSGRFAVKLWPATTPWDAFRRGAELAMTLRHPGVMQVLDFNCEPGAAPFLVLEWIDGRRLSDVIAESGLMPIERVAPIIESAAWALAAAHQQGIVHQELRPDELTVVHAGGTMREWVKVAGFGVSAALARAGTAPPSRSRAPEQRPPHVDHATGAAIGDGAAPAGDEFGDDGGDDPQSDQYALAAIAYEMLAGVPPFDEERSQPEPPPISDLAPGASPAVDAAIRQALATNPEERFAGVLEFARALRAAAEGESLEAVRRRGAEGRASARDRRGGEIVSPFFNPLQGATEALRRVRTTTARLRVLAGARLAQAPLLPLRSSARIALASGALLLAFAGIALVLGRPPRHPTADTAPPERPVAAPVAPASAATPAVAAAPAPVSPVVAPAPPPLDTGAPHAATTVATTPPPRDDAHGKPKRRSAKVGPKVAANVAPKPAAPVTAKVAAAASPASSGSGPCALSVGSHPPADVWIDERSLGRRTPLVGYHLACGDHKLALKRTDLDIYQMEIITLRAGAPFKKTYPLQ
jgi:eukaryotic-like serine/threonine-protein kinase